MHSVYIVYCIPPNLALFHQVLWNHLGKAPKAIALNDSDSLFSLDFDPNVPVIMVQMKIHALAKDKTVYERSDKTGWLFNARHPLCSPLRFVNHFKTSTDLARVTCKGCLRKHAALERQITRTLRLKSERTAKLHIKSKKEGVAACGSPLIFPAAPFKRATCGHCLRLKPAFKTEFDRR